MSILSDRNESVELPEAPAVTAPGEPIEKPRWSRPEITSFKPLADAQGPGVKAGEGINNAIS